MVNKSPFMFLIFIQFSKETMLIKKNTLLVFRVDLGKIIRPSSKTSLASNSQTFFHSEFLKNYLFIFNSSFLFLQYCSTDVCVIVEMLL